MRVLDTHNEQKAAFHSFWNKNCVLPQFSANEWSKNIYDYKSFMIIQSIYSLDEKRFSGKLLIVNLSKSRLLLKDHYFMIFMCIYNQAAW